MMAESKSKSVK